MKYDDLLNIPFKKFGRDKSGYDCYGVVMECCKRAGTPLKDLYGGIVDLPADRMNDYVSGGLNVREIDAPKKGALVYSIYKGNVHIGYIVERGLVLHATIDKGVKISPLAALRPIAYYEVTNESDAIQEPFQQEK
ncbi:MAG: C40 family peptidase [Treponema sp.]|nr:C40 family peptidase [Treponema sp.]